MKQWLIICFLDDWFYATLRNHMKLLTKTLNFTRVKLYVDPNGHLDLCLPYEIQLREDHNGFQKSSKCG